MPIWIRLTWPIAGTPIPEAAGRHLADYLVRYAQTYRTPVHEIGVAPDEVAIVLDLPHDKSLADIAAPLREASARFLKSALGVAGFAWHREWSAESVTAPGGIPEDDEEDDAMPDWLREALENPSSEENG